VGIEEEEEGNHQRKEPVPYRVNYGICTIACELRNLYNS
jgi:hypothetical protein